MRSKFELRGCPRHRRRNLPGLRGFPSNATPPTSASGTPGPKFTLRNFGSRSYAHIMKEAPRQEGEAFIAWARRISDECDKYETNRPSVITEELLEKLSQSG